MKRYYVPRSLRSHGLGPLDARLRRSLKFCAALGAVLALVLTLTPTRKLQPKSKRVVPEMRQARVLTPVKPKPPQRVPPPEVVQKSKPKPAEPRVAQPKPRSKPKPQAVRKKSEPAPVRQAKPASGAPKPGGGEKGRAAGQRVAKDLQKTTSSIDNLLSSLNGTLPVQANGSGGGSKRSAQKYAVVGGRDGKQLASIDGALQGKGAGRGGTSRGVKKGGVDIVDQGVATTGEAASVWGRDSRSLMAVVQRYKSGVKFCYDNALKKAPQLAGKITLQMDIAASGEIEALDVVGDGIGNAALRRCILAQVKSWRFKPIDAGTVRFTLPLVFSPPKG